MSEVRALLLTDVVESTALSARLGEEAAAELWAAHDRVARDLLPTWRGREIDRTDGFLFLFDCADDALGYALAYQRALVALPIAIAARAGIHVGSVFLRHNPPTDVARGAKPLEIEGLAKPVAARVMSIARGGQILLTRAARDALSAAPSGIRSQGFWRLKGIAEPFELFEAGADESALAPPADSDKAWRVIPSGEHWLPARSVRHSLSAERDSFVGRATALRDLAQRFENGARLVSILGTGGAGKTRLATRFGWTWLGDFAGGAWFCDLAEARTPAGIVSAVAKGLDVPPGQDEPIARLGAAIAGRGRCLVILDNFEQVSRWAQDTLGQWLDAAPQACFLVTTRELLHLPGEQALALEPLGSAEGVDLFVRRANAVSGALQLSDSDGVALAQLVELLDGLPLAIELAAARVRVMPPPALLQRMRARFDLLAVSRGRRDRQATLRATLDWSWDLLDPVEQLALMQLAVFAGSFSLEAAEAVLDVSTCADPPWTVDVLQSLVDKSLVRSLPDGRFVLFLSIREYAAERARSGAAQVGDYADLEEAAGHRHCGYFAALDGSQATALRCADLDNLVAACRWAVAHRDAQLAPGALGAAWAALRCRGPFSTGIELATQVGGLHGLDQAARARVELTTGGALSSAGRDTEAQSHFERALQLARSAGVRRIEGQALVALANEELWSGRLIEARNGYANATTLAREIRDVDLECAALNGLGMTAEQCGDMEMARLRYRESLDLALAQGDRHWECGVLGNLGNVWATLGQLNEARKAFEQSLQIAKELGDRERESNALCNLGLLCFTQGDVSAAREHSLAALTAAREMGHRRLECIVLCNLGMIDEQAGDPDSAQRRFEGALAIADDMGDRRTSGQVLTYLALLHARREKFGTALAQMQSAELLLTEVNDLPSLAMLHTAHAEASALMGHVDEARQVLQRAEALVYDLAASAESELGAGLARVRALLGLSDAR